MLFDDEAKKLESRYGSSNLVEKILAEDHQLVRFYLSPESRWDAIAKKSTGLGELITDAMRLCCCGKLKRSGRKRMCG